MEHIQEDYISFETAKLLKQKGFDEGCNKYASLSHISDKYNLHAVGEYTHYRDHYLNYIGEGLRNSDLRINPCGRKEDCMTIPTQALVVKWLRVKYNFNITVEVSVKEHEYRLKNKKPFLWEWQIWDMSANIGMNTNFLIHPPFGERYHKTPEQATEAAILYCLNHLI